MKLSFKVFAMGTWLGMMALVLGGCQKHYDLKIVSSVDLNRYVGVWHEIARYPHTFQEGCWGSQAEYRLLDAETIEVKNSCREEKADGPLRQVTGKAWVVDTQSNAKLKVRFFWPFSGDYWILDLDPDYRTALVGTPDRASLWILHRETSMNPQNYQEILIKVEQLGFDSSRLIVTPQAP
jgi:apolipoprotein D and lipocalin family protein